MKRTRIPVLPIIASFGILAAVALVPARADAQAAEVLPLVEKPVREIERALLISIDGARPDVMLRAKMPNVRKLMEGGSYTFWARTVPVAITLPSHASMLTGVTPEKHGITWNRELDDADAARPKVPTLFEIAMRHGVTTGVVAGKSKFSAFAQPGHVGRGWTQAAKDKEVAAAAVDMIESYHPELLFVHFPGADKAGHAVGWASPEQVAALEEIDKQIGRVIEAIDRSGDRDKTVILLSGDHGGAGRGHGISGAGAPPDDPRNQHIPWIINGPGLRKNYDLSRDAKLQIRTMDTFATLCCFLGITAEGEIDGKPVMLAVEERQLLQESK